MRNSCLRRQWLSFSAKLRAMNGSATIERYEVASAASNLLLRHTDLPPGPADTLTAAGLAAAGRELGALLTRLQSEWAAAPRRFAAEARTGKTLERVGGKRQQFLERYYAAAFAAAVHQLRGLDRAREHLVSWAALRGIDDAGHAIPSVLVWWLNQSCPHCEGRRWKLLAGSPMLSGKICSPCEGTGYVAVPHGSVGRVIAKHMDECVEAIGAGIGARMRA